jgi:3-methylcrotonyl-CoA carboxylase alpha subunit
MERFGIPQVPGYHGDSQEDDFLYKEAERIGFPLLIKASAGGGGKGMRIVEKLSDFHDALGTARREAMNAFGDDRVLLERYITSPRHIEVQVFSDLHGNHVHLYERECSIQRRYQKIVEETPSCALDDKLRLDICECAVKIASSISYLGAGTVEFILDTDGSYYFLEMNTRLQVEHPITEMLCGVDLVRWQIMVAEGREIPLAQKDIIPRGHALEVRIYAEDPGNGFMPSIGNITHRGDVEGSFVRLDAGYNTGNEVTVHFDPMLAKLIVWGETRDQALGRMKVALEQVPFMGLTTNRSYLGRVLEHPEFIAGNTYTHFVKTYEEDLAKDVSEEKMSKVLAAIFLGSEPATANRNSKVSSPWNRSDSWRNV